MNSTPLVLLASATVVATTWFVFTAAVEKAGQERALYEARYAFRVATAHARAADVLAELAACDPSHPWAGEFVDSFGLASRTWWIAPTAGYAERNVECLRDEIDGSGTAELCDGTLVLTQDVPWRWAVPERGGLLPIASFVPVAWGARRYLVRVGRMEAFVNEFNSGQRVYFREAILRRGDDQLEVDGLPEVPPEHASHLLVEPVTGHVVRLCEVERAERALRVDVWLDVGRADGAWVGMEMWPAPYSVDPLTLVEVREHESRATMWVSDVCPAPVVGDTLSTRRP